MRIIRLTRISVFAATLFLLLPVHFNVTASFDAPHKCKHDVDCPKNTNQFCRGDICHDCIRCTDFHRNTGLRSSCLRDHTECGRCFDGYREVINGHPPYEKQCEVQRNSPPHVDTFSVNRRKGSLAKGQTAPSHTAEIGITVGVAIVATAVVAGIMSAVYYHLRNRRLRQAGEKPRVIEMHTFPIETKGQQQTRRQNSEDEFDASPVEISSMTGERDAMTTIDGQEQETHTGLVLASTNGCSGGGADSPLSLTQEYETVKAAN